MSTYDWEEMDVFGDDDTPEQPVNLDLSATLDAETQDSDATDPPLGACFLLPRLSACRPALPAAALIRTYRYRRGADVLRDLLAVKLNANRNVTGNLRGFDQFMNIVLDNTVEEVSETERNDMGLVVRAQPRAEAFLSG